MKPEKSGNDATLEVLRRCCQALDDKKAEEMVVLDVREQSSITNYLVLATGTSEPHLRALRIEIERVLDEEEIRLVGIDTGQESGWTVVDAFEIMIHLFTPETRGRYRLDNLWKDAPVVELEKLLK